MLPLCASLGITVNDLLSGERVSGTNYQKKAEENMMDLMKEPFLLNFSFIFALPLSSPPDNLHAKRDPSCVAITTTT